MAEEESLTHESVDLMSMDDEEYDRGDWVMRIENSTLVRLAQCPYTDCAQDMTMLDRDTAILHYTSHIMCYHWDGIRFERNEAALCMAYRLAPRVMDSYSGEKFVEFAKTPKLAVPTVSLSMRPHYLKFLLSTTTTETASTTATATATAATTTSNRFSALDNSDDSDSSDSSAESASSEEEHIQPSPPPSPSNSSTTSARAKPT